MHLWSRELWHLAGLAALGAGLGGLLGAWALGLAAGLGAALGIHLYRLRALTRWLTRTPRAEPPVAPGLWGELFDRLYRYQKTQHISQNRLRATLERIQQ